MADEETKVTVKEEARLIFDMARARIGSNDDEVSAARSMDSETTADQRQGPPSKRTGGEYLADDRLIDPDHLLQPIEPISTPQLQQFPTISTTDPPYSVDPNSTSVMAEPRLRESPRDALRRLQRKADEARSKGILE